MNKIQYNSELGILMIKISNKDISDTIQTANCIIDYSKDGEPVSIEILDIDIDDILKHGKTLITAREGEGKSPKVPFKGRQT